MLNWISLAIIAVLFVAVIFMVGLYIGYNSGYENGKAVGMLISNELDDLR